MAYGINRLKKRLGGIPEKGKGEYGIRKMKEREERGSVVSVKKLATSTEKLAGNYRIKKSTVKSKAPPTSGKAEGPGYRRAFPQRRGRSG